MGEDLVTCDLAEYYHIIDDFYGLPPGRVAVLVFGLCENSRIKRKLSNQKLTLEQSLLAKICDELSFQSWAQTKDGQKGRNRPASVLQFLLHSGEAKDTELAGFDSGEEFQEAWLKLTKGQENG